MNRQIYYCTYSIHLWLQPYRLVYIHNYLVPDYVVYLLNTDSFVLLVRFCKDECHQYHLYRDYIFLCCDCSVENT